MAHGYAFSSRIWKFSACARCAPRRISEFSNFLSESSEHSWRPELLLLQETDGVRPSFDTLQLPIIVWLKPPFRKTKRKVVPDSAWKNDHACNFFKGFNLRCSNRGGNVDDVTVPLVCLMEKERSSRLSVFLYVRLWQIQLLQFALCVCAFTLGELWPTITDYRRHYRPARLVIQENFRPSSDYI